MAIEPVFVVVAGVDCTRHALENGHFLARKHLGRAHDDRELAFELRAVVLGFVVSQQGDECTAVSGMGVEHILNDVVALVGAAGAHKEVGQFEAIVGVVGIFGTKLAEHLIGLFVSAQSHEIFGALRHGALVAFADALVAIEGDECRLRVAGVVVDGDERGEVVGFFAVGGDHLVETGGAHPLAPFDPVGGQRAEIKFVGGLELCGAQELLCGALLEGTVGHDVRIEHEHRLLEEGFGVVGVDFEGAVQEVEGGVGGVFVFLAQGFEIDTVEGALFAHGEEVAGAGGAFGEEFGQRHDGARGATGAEQHHDRQEADREAGGVQEAPQ